MLYRKLALGLTHWHDDRRRASAPACRRRRHAVAATFLDTEELALLSVLETQENVDSDERRIDLAAAMAMMASPGGDVVFLTTEEAAKLSRLSPRSLARMRGEGRGPRYCKIGGNSKRGRVVYPRAEVIAWLQAGLRSST